ncbi:hypothetical protein MCEMSEM23_01102 [Rhabdaerophilaceae bacterium]
MTQEGKPKSYLAILQKLGIKTSRGTVTESARGFWGGMTGDGTLVVTAWDDSGRGDKSYYEFKRPRRTNGGLQAAWDDGRVSIGAEVKLIIIKPSDPAVPYGARGRKVKSATLMPGKWLISEHAPDDGGDQPIMRVRRA